MNWVDEWGLEGSDKKGGVSALAAAVAVSLQRGKSGGWVGAAVAGISIAIEVSTNPEVRSELTRGYEALKQKASELGRAVESGVKNVLEHFAKEQVKEKVREKAKERREREIERSRIEKHGDSEWEEPAPEGRARWKAKETEQKYGKDKRRQSHDEKQKGEPDRSPRQLDEDYR